MTQNALCFSLFIVPIRYEARGCDMRRDCEFQTTSAGRWMAAKYESCGVINLLNYYETDAWTHVFVTSVLSRAGVEEKY